MMRKFLYLIHPCFFLIIFSIFVGGAQGSIEMTVHPRTLTLDNDDSRDVEVGIENYGDDEVTMEISSEHPDGIQVFINNRFITVKKDDMKTTSATIYVSDNIIAGKYCIKFFAKGGNESVEERITCTVRQYHKIRISTSPNVLYDLKEKDEIQMEIVIENMGNGNEIVTISTYGTSEKILLSLENNKVDIGPFNKTSVYAQVSVKDGASGEEGTISISARIDGGKAKTVVIPFSVSGENYAEESVDIASVFMISIIIVISIIVLALVAPVKRNRCKKESAHIEKDSPEISETESTTSHMPSTAFHIFDNKSAEEFMAMFENIYHEMKSIGNTLNKIGRDMNEIKEILKEKSGGLSGELITESTENLVERSDNEKNVIKKEIDDEDDEKNENREKDMYEKHDIEVKEGEVKEGSKNVVKDVHPLGDMRLSDMRERKCPSCGKFIPDNWIACAYCGFEIK